MRGDPRLPSATALPLLPVLHEEVLHKSHFKKRLLYEISRIHRFLETREQIGGSQGLGEGSNRLLGGHRDSFWDNENVSELDRGGSCTTL